MKTIEELRQQAKESMLSFGWIAADKDGRCFAYISVPKFDNEEQMWFPVGGENYYTLPCETLGDIGEQAAVALWSWEEFFA